MPLYNANIFFPMPNFRFSAKQRHRSGSIPQAVLYMTDGWSLQSVLTKRVSKCLINPIMACCRGLYVPPSTIRKKSSLIVLSSGGAGHGVNVYNALKPLEHNHTS